jgi:flagellar motor switch protein FliN/FliY
MKSFVTDQNERGPSAIDDAPRVSTRLLRNVPVQLEAFVGGARMTVAELAALDAESVVTLDSPLNRSVELRLNGEAVARGELVAVGDQFGVRISEIVQWPE